MTAHDELAQLLKEEYAKKGEDISDSEAEDAARNLVGFFKLLAECAWEDAQRKHRLKKESGGFPVDGTYSCLICGNSINETTGWYHHGGQRCLTCHKAIQEGVVPPFVLWARDSYYKTWKLKDFGIPAPTARKMVREGRLRARIIMGDNGRPHEYLFLKKENPQLAACERWNPVYKSQCRHRDRQAAAQAREERQRLRKTGVFTREASRT